MPYYFNYYFVAIITINYLYYLPLHAHVGLAGPITLHFIINPPYSTLNTFSLS